MISPKPPQLAASSVFPSLLLRKSKEKTELAANEKGLENSTKLVKLYVII